MGCVRCVGLMRTELQIDRRRRLENTCYLRLGIPTAPLRHKASRA